MPPPGGDGGEAVSQGALDRLFSRAAPADRGIPQGTSGKHVGADSGVPALRPPLEGVDSETPSRQTDLSVVTVRRYVNYLVERGEASSTINYDTGGRPLPAVSALH